jgi:hypothetical protein
MNPKRRRALLRLGGGLQWSQGDFNGDGARAQAIATPAAAGARLSRLRVTVRGRGGLITARVGVENADRVRMFRLSEVRFRRRGCRIAAEVSLARAGARRLNQALQLGGALLFLPGEQLGPSRWAMPCAPFGGR